MSYANMDGVPTQTAGTSELLASDWNTYVRDNFDSIKFGHVTVADDAAKSALSVSEGTMVYQLDNNKVFVWSGSAWVEVSDLDNTGAVSDTVQSFLDGYALSSRNVIINGAMQVAQRGTSSTGISSSGYRTADRWVTVYNSAGTWTESIENDGPAGSGFRKSKKHLCTTSTATPNLLLFVQRIEGQNVQHFLKGTSNAKKVSLQFWVKSNVTGTYIVELNDTANNRLISKAYTVNASGAWEKKTLIFDADTSGVLANDNTGAFEVLFWLAAGTTYTSGTLSTSWTTAPTNANRAVGQVNLAAATNNYWQITGVQLEPEVVTPFEFEPYETTLRKCQRYYEKFNKMTFSGYSNGNNSNYIPVALKVSKRDASTTTITNAGGDDVNGSTITAANSTNYNQTDFVTLEVAGGANPLATAGFFRRGYITIEQSAEL